MTDSSGGETAQSFKIGLISECFAASEIIISLMSQICSVHCMYLIVVVAYVLSGLVLILSV